MLRLLRRSGFPSLQHNPPCRVVKDPRRPTSLLVLSGKVHPSASGSTRRHTAVTYFCSTSSSGPVSKSCDSRLPLSPVGEFGDSSWSNDLVGSRTADHHSRVPSASSHQRFQSSVAYEEDVGPPLAASAAAPASSDASYDDEVEGESLWNHRASTNPLVGEEALADNDDNDSDNNDNHVEPTTTFGADPAYVQHLQQRRVVGIFAHVDAGKTTCTERMLALAGVVRRAGSVDDGDTVTDYLDAERERGITIQSAAVSFPWKIRNRRKRGTSTAEATTKTTPDPSVTITVIDTPGHIDFSVEVHRSVAVLDGAVLVVDAVAGVQAQTETVWKAIRHRDSSLPAMAVINKMDKEGRHFGNAVKSLRDKLPHAHPIPIQIPLFRRTDTGIAAQSPPSSSSSSVLPPDVVAGDTASESLGGSDFAGIIDLIDLRAVLWPDLARTNGFVSRVEDCCPTTVSLVPQHHDNNDNNDNGVLVNIPASQSCPVLRKALQARRDLVEALARVDEAMADCYLEERDPTPDELRCSVRRATLANHIVPVVAAAAARGKGVEPVLDAVADYLPSPLDRPPPALLSQQQQRQPLSDTPSSSVDDAGPPLGHALHPSLLALAFKVVHLKGKAGSGDGRVVFARVYSGQLQDRQLVQVVSPPAPGDLTLPHPPRTERVGGFLELSGGRFGKLTDGIVCISADVCALIGLKSVVTGDTLTAPTASAKQQHSKHRPSRSTKTTPAVYLAGVAPPKPVLTVRLEADSTQLQAKLSDALALLTVEDPSLVVHETDSATELSGLGELHVEVTLDRLQREFGLEVRVGPPAVAYREALVAPIETSGLVSYQRTVGGTCLQGSVQLRLEPTTGLTDSATPNDCDPLDEESSCRLPADPVVLLGPEVRDYLGLDPTALEEDLILLCPVTKALIEGCRGALKRGPSSQHPLANVVCHVENVDSASGLAAWQALPGALRAAAANAVSTLLSAHRGAGRVLEPVMGIELALPNALVGAVLADLTSRRGTVHEVLVGGDVGGGGVNSGASLTTGSKAQIRGTVPLVEILGYANGLRSLTGGEGSFTAEYRGHAPSSDPFR